MFTHKSFVDMTVPNTKLANLISQLHNRTNETKEVFDRALIELEEQKADYARQVKQLKDERRKWDEEQTIMNALLASANPIVHLNVGGEKMSTTRATLTLVEGSLLAVMFSGKWDGKLTKDANGHIFLDYDPTVSDTLDDEYISDCSSFAAIQTSSQSTSYLVRSIDQTHFSSTSGIRTIISRSPSCIKI